MIWFNKPYTTGQEIRFLDEAVRVGKLSGNGVFTKRCHQFFQERYGFKKCLLTHSCTAALEMAAILLDVKPGDEVIMPSYTFVSTANAFVLRGAKIVFCDSYSHHPNIDHSQIESLITKATKAIVVVHYGGMACEMDSIMEIAERHKLFVVEDAAHSIESFYKKRPLGSIGHLAAFSFHETKNISSGEGGMLVINDDRFLSRSEIVWEKGTNRAAFWRGEVDKYNWVDIGSSFLPSELTAAFLYAQLLSVDSIQQKRVDIWNRYFEAFNKSQFKNKISLIKPESYGSVNGHLFALITNNLEERDKLIQFLKEQGIMALFHYISLHGSPYFKARNKFSDLPGSDRFSDCLIRLPLFFELSEETQKFIIESLSEILGNL